MYKAYVKERFSGNIARFIINASFNILNRELRDFSINM